MSDTIEARFNTVLNTNERLKRELSAAKAEIARLTMRLEDIRDGTGEDHIRWLAKEGLLFCLKPDTGEQPIRVELVQTGTNIPDPKKGTPRIKPDTGEGA